MNLSRAKEIMAVWEAIEDGEPEISTERLIEQTRCAVKRSHDDVMTALRLTQEVQP